MAGTTDVAQSCTSRCRHCTLYTGQQKQLNLWHHPDPDTCGCMICLSLQGRQLAEVKLQVGQLHAATKAGGRAARRQVDQQQPVTMQVDQVSNSQSQWTRCANWWRMSCERTYPSLGSLAASAVATAVAAIVTEQMQAQQAITVATTMTEQCQVQAQLVLELGQSSQQQLKYLE